VWAKRRGARKLDSDDRRKERELAVQNVFRAATPRDSVVTRGTWNGKKAWLPNKAGGQCVLVVLTAIDRRRLYGCELQGTVDPRICLSVSARCNE